MTVKKVWVVEGSCIIQVLPVFEINGQNSKLNTKVIQSQKMKFKARRSQFLIGLHYNSPSTTEENRKLMLEEIQGDGADSEYVNDFKNRIAPLFEKQRS